MRDDRLFSSAQLLEALSNALGWKVLHHHVRWLFQRGDLEAVPGNLAKPNDKRRVRTVAARLVYTPANARFVAEMLRALHVRKPRQSKEDES